MRLLGFSAVGALLLVACGVTRLGSGGPQDHGADRTTASPREPHGPSFCSGANWSDPGMFVLIGGTDDSVVFVRADGAQKVAVTLKGGGTFSWKRAGDY